MNWKSIALAQRRHDQVLVTKINTVRRARFGALLVLLQFSLICWLAYLGGPTFAHSDAPVAASSVLAAGLLLGIWSLLTNRPGNFYIRPIPRPRGQLVTTGPYRWIRHPMYTSVLACGAAAALASTEHLTAWATFCSLLIVLTFKASAEERWLCEVHSGYAAYMKVTKRFLPGVV